MSRVAYLHQLSAKLAIFSIVMLFIAPFISKALFFSSATSHHAIMATMPMQDMPMMDMTMTADAPHSDSHTTTSSLPLDDLACGYCQLLVHFPFLQFIIALFVWLFFIHVSRVAFIAPRAIVLVGFWSPGRARGPPLFIN